MILDWDWPQEKLARDWGGGSEAALYALKVSVGCQPRWRFTDVVPNCWLTCWQDLDLHYVLQLL